MPPLARLPLLLLAMLALVVGVLAGLARLAVEVPALTAAQAGVHGALMIAAFLGTVISLERAVALARRWPYLAPLCAGLGGLSLLAGVAPDVVQALFVIAAGVLLAGSVLILRQQPLLHNATLALGALCWLVGALVWSVGDVIAFAVPWWLAFPVLTIAGERLELTRFLPTSAVARKVFMGIVALLLFALSATFWQADAGLRLFAAMLLALALWLLRQDIARRTVRQAGLTRFIAVCLLAGYVWLACAGLLGMAGGLAAASPLRDAALHAVLVGFVFSMIFGHAPIIFPAIAKIRIPYHPVFYVPLAALHASLLARLAGDLLAWTVLTQYAALGNALALLLFVLTLLTSIARGWRGSAAETFRTTHPPLQGE